MGDILVETAVLGSELALVAVGMTLVFGVSRFANVAQVEFATLGAYGTLLVATIVGGGLLIDSAISIVAVGVLAVVLYHVLFKRLLRRSSATAMIGSLALSILVRAFIQTLVGPDPRTVDVPLERGVEMLGTLVTPMQIRIAAISAAALLLVLLIVRVTPLGRAMRAVSTNPDLAAAAGIDVRRVTDMVWLIAGLLGGLAGVMLAIDTQVSLNMGFTLLLPMFAAALLGGFGSPGGAILASYLLAAAGAAVLRIDFGELVGATSALLPTAYRPAVGFVLLIVVLLVRPQGIFGRAARRA